MITLPKIMAALIVIPQMIAALVIGMGYYMLAVIDTVYDGVLSMIFQPIMGFILTSIAIVALLLAGVPIRVIGPVNRWWRAHWWLAIVLAGIAFVMMAASFLPSLRVSYLDDIHRQMVESPNPYLGVAGWLLTLFCVLHFYPPFFLIGRLIKKLNPQPTQI